MTTTTALPVACPPLEAALRQRRPVRVSYHGKQRLVCPHALGWNNDRPMVLAYQTGGETTSGTLPADPRTRWRCLFVDEIDQVDAGEPASAWGSADNYNPSHPFHVIDEIAVAITADGSHRLGWVIRGGHQKPLLRKGYEAPSRASQESPARPRYSGSHALNNPIPHGARQCQPPKWPQPAISLQPVGVALSIPSGGSPR